MPVHLGAIPPPAPVIQRPYTRRWLVFLAVILPTGNGVTFWLWPDSRSGCEFWIMACGLPVAIWGLLFFLRRVGYKCDQIWAAAWNRERERVINQETRRGQRYAWLIHSGLVTQAGYGTEKFINTFSAKNPLLAVQPPRTGETPVRHSRLAGFSRKRLAADFDDAVTTLVMEMKTTLDSIPANIDCWLALECDIKNLPDALQRISKIVTQQAVRKYHHIASVGLSTVDHWLDQTWDTPAILVSVSVQLNGDKLLNTGEAITLLMLSNRRHPDLTNSVRVHRPEIGAISALPNTLTYALMWAKSTPEDIFGAWTSGPSIAHGADWINACDKNGLSLNMTTDSHDIDQMLGYAGKAAPWLALIFAAMFVKKGASQIIAAQTGEYDIGVALVTSEE